MEMTLWTNKDPVNQHHHVTTVLYVVDFSWCSYRQYKKLDMAEEHAGFQRDPPLT